LSSDMSRQRSRLKEYPRRLFINSAGRGVVVFRTFLGLVRAATVVLEPTGSLLADSEQDIVHTREPSSVLSPPVANQGRGDAVRVAADCRSPLLAPVKTSGCERIVGSWSAAACAAVGVHEARASLTDAHGLFRGKMCVSPPLGRVASLGQDGR